MGKERVLGDDVNTLFHFFYYYYSVTQKENPASPVNNIWFEL